jgi:hypothetical protein
MLHAIYEILRVLAPTLRPATRYVSYPCGFTTVDLSSVRNDVTIWAHKGDAAGAFVNMPQGWNVVTIAKVLELFDRDRLATHALIRSRTVQIRFLLDETVSMIHGLKILVTNEL